MTTSEPVLIERRGRLLVITLNRPQVRNAVDGALARGLAAALDALDGDDALGAGVLTGAGGGFCAGLDLKAFLAGESSDVEGRGFAGIAERAADKPLVAAIEGFAVAGGFEIALACDLIVAARDARLGIPEVQRALVPAGGALLRLPSRIPYHAAAELALTGDLVEASRLYELGLVNRLTEPGGALEAAVELAERVARNGPLAVRTVKRVLAEAPGWAADQTWQRQAELVAPVIVSEDAREGSRAFTEKRVPVWTGR
jgi:enoyl-CoA hydratase